MINEIQILRHAINNFNSYYFAFNKDYKIIWYNKKCEELFKDKNSNWLDIIFTENNIDYKEFISNLKNKVNDYTWVFKLCLNNIDGYFKITISRILNSPIIYLVIIEDVTYEENIKEELQIEKMYMRNIMTKIPDAIYIKDKDSKFLRINKTQKETLGVKKEEDAIGKADSDFFTEEHWKDALNDERQLIEGKLPFVKKEELIRHSDGNFKWVSTIKAPLVDQFDEIIGTLGITRDITDKKLTESALLKSEKLFKSIWNNSVDGMRILDQDGNIFMVNPAFCEMVGLSEDELIGKPISVLFYKELDEIKNPEIKAKKLNELSINIKNKNIPHRFENCLHLWNDKHVWFEITNGFIEIDNNTYLLSVFRDISERKNFENELEKSEKELKILNSNKDKFFSIIAHDLKSPFQSILGLYNLLKEEYDNLSREEVKEIILNLGKSSENLYNLIENLLEWSRVQIGKFEIDKTLFNITELINKIIILLKGNYIKKNIDVIFNTDKKIFVYADIKMINSVISNLITNSIKFTPRGGKINISIKTNNNHAIIEICDNGIGMEKNILESLFKIESNITRKGTENERGTGLGLILCKEFIEKNGGQLIVSSEVNKGSCFSFTLPLQA